MPASDHPVSEVRWIPVDTDIAWLAGLFDGEGSVGSQRVSPTNVGALLQMSMTDKATIDHAIYLLRGIGVSALGYTYQEKKSHHKDAHYIRITRASDVMLVAEALLPYAITKREHWKSVLEMSQIKIARRRVMPDGRLARGGKPAAPITEREFDIHECLRALNHREKPA